MEHSVKYKFLMSALTHIEDLKETEKTKISVVYHKGLNTSCILRICKGRDLSPICSTLKQIRNQNTVVIHDFVYENGDTYILEENIDGSTVAELIDDNGVFSEQQTAKIIIEVCKALEELHQEKPPVVHNDINPSNIKIRDDGSVKLFDFDISRTYKKGQRQNTVLFGTEEYAAPEHYGYGQSEPRTDIYCLGVTMHEMLTGQTLCAEHKSAYNGGLKKIVQKCLEFDPDNRYDSALALRKELEALLQKKQDVLRKAIFLITVFVVILSLAVLLLSNKSSEDNSAMAEASMTDSVSPHTESPVKDNILTNSESSAGTESEPDSTDSNTVADINKPDENKEDNKELITNDSRERAIALAFNQTMSDYVKEESADWYSFTANEEICAYRIAASPVESDKTTYTYLRVALYDTLGIKIEELLIHCDSEYDFCDLYLEPDQEYFIKVYSTDPGNGSKAGYYELCISEFLCDAGADKSSATELELGVKHNAVLDSTLSDWYAFRIPEEGEYTYTIHNVDVGCEIYFSKQQPNSSGEGMYIANEDSFSGNIINLNKGDTVYFEIYSYGQDPSAKGNYIITVEKSN